LKNKKQMVFLDLFDKMKIMNNYAFIDGNNLPLGASKGLGWNIDYAN